MNLFFTSSVHLFSPVPKMGISLVSHSLHPPEQSWAGFIRAQKMPRAQAQCVPQQTDGSCPAWSQETSWGCADPVAGIHWFLHGKDQEDQHCSCPASPCTKQEDGGEEGQMSAFLSSQHSCKVLSAFICLLIARCICFTSLSSAILCHVCWKVSRALPFSPAWLMNNGCQEKVWKRRH